MYEIKQSTAITVPFFVHNASGDAVTGLSDGSFTKRISKNGASFGAMTVTISEMENGWYSIPLSTSHSDTTGLLSITFTNAGAKSVNLQWRVEAKLTDDLQDITTAQVNIECDQALTDYDGPTDSEMNARTIPSANYFDPANDDVAVVTLVNTLTTYTGNTPQTGDAFLRLATYRLGELMSEALASQPFTASLMGDLTQDNADDAGTQQFSVAALMRTWDEVLLATSHNIANSSGKRLRILSGVVFADGTAQSATANTIRLASGDVTIDDQFVRSKVVITGGTGAGQEAIITDSVASTDTLTITPAWNVTPDATSDYDIIPAQSHQTVRNGGYDGARVYVDTANGVSGTQKGVVGTSTNPVDNLTDAYVIATNENLSIFSIKSGSALTLPASSTDRTFIGEGAYTVALNSADIDASNFVGGTITGTATAGSGNPPGFQLCSFGAVTLPPCNGNACGFFGIFTIGSAGNFTFGNSADVFDLSLTLDYGSGLNASQFFLFGWNGGTVEIRNTGAGTGTYKFHMTGRGDLTINANCSDTTEIDLHGHIALVNNSSITSIVTVANYTLTSIISDSIAFQGADIADTLADTDELQTDWKNTGRLDNILDSRMAEASIDTTAGAIDAVTLVDTVTDVTNQVTADVTAISGDSAAADNLEASMETLTLGTATGTPTTTTMADSALTETTNDHYNGRVIAWRTGDLQGQAAAITAYDGSTKTFTFTGVTNAASNGDFYVIV